MANGPPPHANEEDSGSHQPQAPEKLNFHAIWKRIRTITLMSWDGFWDDNCTLAASSLAYQSALALVPLLAIGLALLKASGQLEAGSSLVTLMVESVFPSAREVQQVVIERLSSFSGNLAAGALGSFGLVTSTVIGFLLFLSVESIWNRIWDSQRERSYIERFLFFYTFVTLLPFVAAISLLHTASLWGKYAFSRLFLSVFATAAALTLANRFIPTLRVEWRPALVGGFTSALMLEIAKFGIGLYLSWVTGKYTSIYGALGVVPLFLLSIYVSWVLVLWGVEVCRAVQRLPLHLSRKEGVAQHSADGVQISGPLAARLLCDVARHFQTGNKALPVLELEQRHGLPESVVRRIMKRMAGKGLVVEHLDGYLLAKPPESISLVEVLRIFQPPAHFYAQNVPDKLDEVLASIETCAETESEKVTFATLTESLGRS